MKIPLMKINGNLIKLESIIILDGAREDGDAKRTPKDAKQILPQSMAVKSRIIFMMAIFKKTKPKINTIVVITNPNITPASISPRIMILTVTGYDNSLS